jgi:DNA-binding MarR family transcriptional regulator
MSGKYGGATTLNELVMLNYGFVCHAGGEGISVTDAAETLGMPKSTVSRILTGMREKGFVTEQAHPTDRRRRVFRLKESYLDKGNDDIKRFLDWCAKPENALT